MERRYNHQLTRKLRIAASAANQQPDFSLKLKLLVLVMAAICQTRIEIMR